MQGCGTTFALTSEPSPKTSLLLNQRAAMNINGHHSQHVHQNVRAHALQLQTIHLHTHSKSRMVQHVNSMGAVHTVAKAGPSITLLVNVLA